MSQMSKLPADSPLLRFGPKAEVLAEALHMMSLSLVKMVLVYLVHPTATTDGVTELLFSVGSKGTGDGQFTGAVYGVLYNHDNKLWTACDDKVQLFSEDGKFLKQAAPGEWKDAAGIAFDAEGNAYICDYALHCINVCRPDGSFVRKIGEYGTGEGKFHNPSRIALDTKQQLMFVGENWASRVSVMKLDGTFVRAIGTKGTGSGQLDRPRGIAINSVGEIGVTCNFIQVFDYNGKFLRRFGSKGLGPGQFDDPLGLAADSAGNWLVCDCRGNGIMVWSSAGHLITTFGGITRPICVHVDREDRILIGTDESQVLVFGFVVSADD